MRRTFLTRKSVLRKHVPILTISMTRPELVGGSKKNHFQPHSQYSLFSDLKRPKRSLDKVIATKNIDQIQSATSCGQVLELFLDYNLNSMSCTDIGILVPTFFRSLISTMTARNHPFQSALFVPAIQGIDQDHILNSLDETALLTISWALNELCLSYGDEADEKEGKQTSLTLVNNCCSRLGPMILSDPSSPQFISHVSKYLKCSQVSSRYDADFYSSLLKCLSSREQYHSARELLLCVTALGPVLHPNKVSTRWHQNQLGPSFSTSANNAISFSSLSDESGIASSVTQSFLAAVGRQILKYPTGNHLRLLELFQVASTFAFHKVASIDLITKILQCIEEGSNSFQSSPGFTMSSRLPSRRPKRRSSHRSRRGQKRMKSHSLLNPKKGNSHVEDILELCPTSKLIQASSNIQCILTTAALSPDIFEDAVDDLHVRFANIFLNEMLRRLNECSPDDILSMADILSSTLRIAAIVGSNIIRYPNILPNSSALMQTTLLGSLLNLVISVMEREVSKVMFQKHLHQSKFLDFLADLGWVFHIRQESSYNRSLTERAHTVVAMACQNGLVLSQSKPLQETEDDQQTSPLLLRKSLPIDNLKVLNDFLYSLSRFNGFHDAQTLGLIHTWISENIYSLLKDATTFHSLGQSMIATSSSSLSSSSRLSPNSTILEFVDACSQLELDKYQQDSPGIIPLFLDLLVQAEPIYNHENQTNNTNGYTSTYFSVHKEEAMHLTLTTKSLTDLITILAETKLKHYSPLCSNVLEIILSRIDSKVKDLVPLDPFDYVAMVEGAWNLCNLGSTEDSFLILQHIANLLMTEDASSPLISLTLADTMEQGNQGNQGINDRTPLNDSRQLRLYQLKPIQLAKLSWVFAVANTSATAIFSSALQHILRTVAFFEASAFSLTDQANLHLARISLQLDFGLKESDLYALLHTPFQISRPHRAGNLHSISSQSNTFNPIYTLEERWAYAFRKVYVDQVTSGGPVHQSSETAVDRSGKQPDSKGNKTWSAFQTRRKRMLRKVLGQAIESLSIDTEQEENEIEFSGWNWNKQYPMTDSRSLVQSNYQFSQCGYLVDVALLHEKIALDIVYDGEDLTLDSSPSLLGHVKIKRRLLRCLGWELVTISCSKLEGFFHPSSSFPSVPLCHETSSIPAPNSLPPELLKHLSSLILQARYRHASFLGGTSSKIMRR